MIVLLIVILILIIIFAGKRKDDKEYRFPFSKKETEEEKGARGEKYVRFELERCKNENAYIVNDLFLKGQDGKTAQIDHVFINKNGIWVIETKNYSGKIFGKEEDREWTQVLAYGEEKHKFYNPIKQNNTHVYRVKEKLGWDSPVFSVVVFIDADISNVKATGVYYANELKRVLWMNTGINLKEKEMDQYYNELLYYKETCIITKEEHIENIQRTQRDLGKKICPRCGGNLLIRVGTYGDFYGCENYPKCKFTMNKE